MNTPEKFVIGQRFYSPNIDTQVYLQEKLATMGFKVSDWYVYQALDGTQRLGCTLNSSVEQREWDADPATFYHYDRAAQNALAYLIDQCNRAIGGKHRWVLECGTPPNCETNSHDFELILNRQMDIAETVGDDVPSRHCHMLRLAQELDNQANLAAKAHPNWFTKHRVNIRTLQVPWDYVANYVYQYNAHLKKTDVNTREYVTFTNPDLDLFCQKLGNGELDSKDVRICTHPCIIFSQMVLNANQRGFVAVDYSGDYLTLRKKA